MTNSTGPASAKPSTPAANTSGFWLTSISAKRHEPSRITQAPAITAAR